MRASSSAASDWRKSSRMASTCASTGSAITAQASRRSLSARAAKVAMAAASADSGPGAASAAAFMAVEFAAGDGGHQLGDEIGLGREVAIDRAGGDAGALGDRGDLHRRHAALGGDGRRRRRGSPARARPGGGPRSRCGDRAWQRVNDDSRQGSKRQLSCRNSGDASGYDASRVLPRRRRAPFRGCRRASRSA